MKNIYAALINCQKTLKRAEKDGTNPHFKSRYSTLESVWTACQDSLIENGLAVIQSCKNTDFGYFLSTTIIHSSGESIESQVPMVITKLDMQGLGSALTYARRYGLASALGIVSDDDDGNLSVEQSRQPLPEKKSNPVAPTTRPSQKVEPKLVPMIFETYKQAYEYRCLFKSQFINKPIGEIPTESLNKAYEYCVGVKDKNQDMVDFIEAVDVLRRGEK